MNPVDLLGAKISIGVCIGMTHPYIEECSPLSLPETPTVDVKACIRGLVIMIIIIIIIIVIIIITIIIIIVKDIETDETVNEREVIKTGETGQQKGAQKADGLMKG